MSLTEHQLRAKIAAEHSRRNPDPARIAELRGQQHEALIASWLERHLASGPPLSQATRERLARLLTMPAGQVTHAP